MDITLHLPNSHWFFSPRLAPDFKTFKSNISPERTTYEVDGLSPARDYVFQMAAVNDVGTGRFSAIIGGRTLEAGSYHSQHVRLYL